MTAGITKAVDVGGCAGYVGGPCLASSSGSRVRTVLVACIRSEAAFCALSPSCRRLQLLNRRTQYSTTTTRRSSVAGYTKRHVVGRCSCGREYSTCRRINTSSTARAGTLYCFQSSIQLARSTLTRLVDSITYISPVSR